MISVRRSIRGQNDKMIEPARTDRPEVAMIHGEDPLQFQLFRYNNDRSVGKAERQILIFSHEFPAAAQVGLLQRDEVKGSGFNTFKKIE